MISIVESNENEGLSELNIDYNDTEAPVNAVHGNDAIHGLVKEETEAEHGEYAVVPTDDTPPRRVRSLQDVYERCSFALNVAAPLIFEEEHKYCVWREAMKQEMESIMKNETWELVPAPIEKKIVGLKWVYKMKYTS